MTDPQNSCPNNKPTGFFEKILNREFSIRENGDVITRKNGKQKVVGKLNIEAITPTMSHKSLCIHSNLHKFKNDITFDWFEFGESSNKNITASHTKYAIGTIRDFGMEVVVQIVTRNASQGYPRRVGDSTIKLLPIQVDSDLQTLFYLTNP
jgi:hypothetical protein